MDLTKRPEKIDLTPDEVEELKQLSKLSVWNKLLDYAYHCFAFSCMHADSKAVSTYQGMAHGVRFLDEHIKALTAKPSKIVSDEYNPPYSW